MELHNCIRQFFEQRLGLNTEYLSQASWERAICERMTQSRCSDENKYCTLLAADKFECQKLIDLVVVPETWFFRDAYAIDSLVDWVKQGLQCNPHRCFRILSMPCSSGEEPYSIAIALSHAGFSSSNYFLEAIDISSKLIEKAIQGIYGKNSFRTIDDKFYSEYFSKLKEQYILDKNICSKVSFRQGNVLDDLLFPQDINYDAIFCRNLLIYMTPEAQKKLLALLAHLLSYDGRLFVAPSELELARSQGFQAVGEAQTCALRYEPIEQTAPKTQTNIREIADICLARVDAYPDKLQEAINLADKGCFENAQRFCVEYLQTHKDDAQAYFLLGVISHANDNIKQAEEYFLKTLYLCPNHLPALVYMALLMERKGDHKRAELFRERIQK